MFYEKIIFVMWRQSVYCTVFYAEVKQVKDPLFVNENGEYIVMVYQLFHLIVCIWQVLAGTGMYFDQTFTSLVL